MLRLVVILGSLALPAACLLPAEAEAKGGVTFRPTADAYVTAAAPRRNFGRAKVLRAGRTPITRSYVRFNVTGLDAPVTSAVVRFFARSPSTVTVRATYPYWSEGRITYANSPDPGGLLGSSRARRGQWMSIDVKRLVTGNGSFNLAVTGTGTLASREAGSSRPYLMVIATAPLLMAAGDIGDCASPWDEATATLLKGMPGTIAALGDLAYDQGTTAEFNACYQPTWGQFKDRTKPAPGNHEYGTPGAAGYFSYWGSVAGNPAQGWYSYDLGGWHVVSLNSNCSFIGGCQAGSPQEAWLRADLAAAKQTCTLAYWHHPRFSGGLVTNDAEMAPLWQALYDANADVVLVGHAHNYQRFAAQNALGVADGARGLREFVVGTGGHGNLHPVAAIANTEVMNASSWGVLQLTLRNSGYDWHFVPVAGQSFTDTGSQACH